MLEKTYDAKAIEPRIAKVWEDADAFRAGAGAAEDAEPFTIVIPPPNVTGSLHMGHALNNTLQDILIRFERMRGKNVLWQPGMDHAGIATQMVVERQLMERQIQRRDIGREEFVRKVWDWKAESGGMIFNQLKRLGASCDWSRERFTMDEGLSKAVLEVFVTLYHQGLIYKDKRLVNWDPKLLTAISDLEVEQQEVDGNLWHFRYPVEGMSLRSGQPGDLHHGRHDAAGNHARRHRRCRPSQGRTLRASRRQERHPAAGRPPDPGRRRRIFGSGKGQRRGQDHAGARFQRLRSRQTPSSARRQHHDCRGSDQPRGQRGLPRRPRIDARTAGDGRRRAWPGSLHGAQAGGRDDGGRRLSRKSRAAPARRSAWRPRRRADRTVPHRSVVRQCRRTGQAGDRIGQGRAHQLCAEELGEDLFRLDGEHPALVHLAPAVVGTPDPCMVWPGRPRLRRAHAKRKRCTRRSSIICRTKGR